MGQKYPFLFHIFTLTLTRGYFCKETKRVFLSKSCQKIDKVLSLNNTFKKKKKQSRTFFYNTTQTNLKFVIDDCDFNFKLKTIVNNYNFDEDTLV